MKYVKRPIPVEAVQIFAQTDMYDLPYWVTDAFLNNTISYANTASAQYGLVIKTLEGDMFAPWGSYIIKGVDGELYPVRRDIFEKTYIPYEE